ncbi:MAG: hypothetical protein HWN66_01635 [Candidatus Helarchaeota archaeon]|nr:hypothetical protein [Candidatus Helarchaeota archaeon]
MIPREKLHKERSQSLLVAMIYVEIYSQMQQKYDLETAAEKLKNFGRNIAKSYYQYYKPSKSSISETIRELALKIGAIKKLKLRRVDDGFTLTSTDCPLCVEDFEVEGQGPAYCYPICGILEEYLNLIFKDNPRKFRYKEAIGRVVKSKSCGADMCEYHYRLVEK